jgi:hypothetical protein
MVTLFPVKLAHGRQLPRILFEALREAGYIEPHTQYGYVRYWKIDPAVSQLTTQELEDLCAAYLAAADR